MFVVVVGVNEERRHGHICDMFLMYVLLVFIMRRRHGVEGMCVRDDYCSNVLRTRHICASLMMRRDCVR